MIGVKFICSSVDVHCAFFFFSSRRRHTRLVSDWSSDVCSSDLVDIADASRLVEAAGAEGARAAVNFPFVSSFAVDQIGTWIAEGAVGEPRAIRIEVAFARWPRSW